MGIEKDFHWREGSLSHVGTLFVCTMLRRSNAGEIAEESKSRDPRNHAVDHSIHIP
jgi:hypothetical protein